VGLLAAGAPLSSHSPTRHHNPHHHQQQQDGSGKSRGFGFVNFETPEAAAAACDALNGTDVEGKTMYAGRAQKKAERESVLRAKFEEVRGLIY